MSYFATPSAPYPPIQELYEKVIDNLNAIDQTNLGLIFIDEYGQDVYNFAYCGYFYKVPYESGCESSFIDSVLLSLLDHARLCIRLLNIGKQNNDEKYGDKKDNNDNNNYGMIYLILRYLYSISNNLIKMDSNFFYTQLSRSIFELIESKFIPDLSVELKLFNPILYGVFDEDFEYIEKFSGESIHDYLHDYNSHNLSIYLEMNLIILLSSISFHQHLYQNTPAENCAFVCAFYISFSPWISLNIINSCLRLLILFRNTGNLEYNNNRIFQTSSIRGAILLKVQVELVGLSVLSNTHISKNREIELSIISKSLFLILSLPSNIIIKYKIPYSTLSGPDIPNEKLMTLNVDNKRIHIFDLQNIIKIELNFPSLFLDLNLVLSSVWRICHTYPEFPKISLLTFYTIISLFDYEVNYMVRNTLDYINLKFNEEDEVNMQNTMSIENLNNNSEIWTTQNHLSQHYWKDCLKNKIFSNFIKSSDTKFTVVLHFLSRNISTFDFMNLYKADSIDSIISLCHLIYEVFNHLDYVNEDLVDLNDVFFNLDYGIFNSIEYAHVIHKSSTPTLELSESCFKTLLIIANGLLEYLVRENTTVENLVPGTQTNDNIAEVINKNNDSIINDDDNTVNNTINRNICLFLKTTNSSLIRLTSILLNTMTSIFPLLSTMSITSCNIYNDVLIILYKIGPFIDEYQWSRIFSKIFNKDCPRNIGTFFNKDLQYICELHDIIYNEISINNYNQYNTFILLKLYTQVKYRNGQNQSKLLAFGQSSMDFGKSPSDVILFLIKKLRFISIYRQVEIKNIDVFFNLISLLYFHCQLCPTGDAIYTVDPKEISLSITENSINKKHSSSFFNILRKVIVPPDFDPDGQNNDEYDLLDKYSDLVSLNLPIILSEVIIPILKKYSHFKKSISLIKCILSFIRELLNVNFESTILDNFTLDDNGYLRYTPPVESPVESLGENVGKEEEENVQNIQNIIETSGAVLLQNTPPTYCILSMELRVLLDYIFTLISDVSDKKDDILRIGNLINIACNILLKGKDINWLKTDFLNSTRLVSDLSVFGVHFNVVVKKIEDFLILYDNAGMEEGSALTEAIYNPTRFLNRFF